MVPHYAYLKMKIPGKDGRVITVHGDFARADKCDRDFHKIAESFGMQKEFQELKETTDYNELPLTQRPLRSSIRPVQRRSRCIRRIHQRPQ